MQVDNLVKADKEVALDYVLIDNEKFFKISNSDQMRPFFMSIVSDSDHWMFISSNGGLTAGRKNSEYALFPYYTDDKITESADITGSKSIFRVFKNGKTHTWEPFTVRSEKNNITQNLYKNKYGNKIVFEEINHDLELSFSYLWSSSDEFGFVRKSKLVNTGTDNVSVELLDGIQNLVPAGIGSYIQNQSSNLVDAYKRNELDAASGLGIYTLSAILVDKAEASEALKANVVWSFGLDDPIYLVSSLQLDNFRKGIAIFQETDVKAEKGAYFVSDVVDLTPGVSKEWTLVANVNQDHSDVALLINTIKNDDELSSRLSEDIALGSKHLVDLVAAADGIQSSGDSQRDTRHFSNTLFNIMRGGIFDNNYQIEKWDFKSYLFNANKKVALDTASIIESLPEVFLLEKLHELIDETYDLDFARLCYEYLPLKFSRRHGDPSRPWNKFSINTRDESGNKILDYEGNWRDIFQNWEALAHSYPEFIDGMIHKFLNASTFDGYNPYRVTKGGFDWEIIEPDDPWSYIGYWGDHQIIYLLKFLEFINNHKPEQLERYFTQDLFVYANVPYKVKSYKETLKTPKDTIVFDEAADIKIRKDRDKLGADGALLRTKDNTIVRVNFIEKILATSLAKISNFIPEGGIWMNTQRPEWNDANNALVGNGVSMVTLYYLRRFFKFFEDVLGNTSIKEVTVSKEILDFFDTVLNTFESHQSLLEGPINDADRKTILNNLGGAGSLYRETVYQHSFSGDKAKLSIKALKKYVSISNEYLEHSIKANKRADGLYHAYNLMTAEDTGISISYLSEMLEGQVAVLSSGYLSANEVIGVLDAMKQSKLFREDQYSYLLYPNKELKGFLDKNMIPHSLVQLSDLLTKMVNNGDTQIIEKDINGKYHFNGNFRNADDVSNALQSLTATQYESLANADSKKVLDAFEAVFNHKAFTGRSGTFYGYEGLGSIYWHMVSKLLLAVEECCTQAVRQGEDDIVIGRLLEHYYEINEGIGVHKPPTLYGAFPTDPYSHTPLGKGAQQPGMTGQVKEDILSRFGELGIYVKEGKLGFYPRLLRKTEFVKEAKSYTYITLSGDEKTIQLNKGTLGFTYCQVPIIYQIADKDSLEVHFNDGNLKIFQSLEIDKETSQQVFKRTDDVNYIKVLIEKSQLK
jgi:hypothetical protein